MEEKKINFAAAEIIKLTAGLELSPREALTATLKAMHFIIEKGFCQSEAKTAEIIAKALGSITLINVVSQN